jgi:hypothetical protein
MFSLPKGDTAGNLTDPFHILTYFTRGNFSIILTYTPISVEVVLWVYVLAIKFCIFYVCPVPASAHLFLLGLLL